MKEKIIALFNDNKFLNLDEICAFLNEDKNEIEKYLSELCDSYILYKNKKGNYGLLASFNYYLGEIELKKKGYGFFKCDALEEDIFISEYDLDNALDGDEVIVWADINEDKNFSNLHNGRVIKVIKHKRKIICKLIKKFFHNDNKMLVCETYPDVKIICDDMSSLNIGDILLCNILDVDLIKKGIIKVSIEKKIANMDDKDCDVKALIAKYDLIDSFSDAVLKEVDEINQNYLNNFEEEKQRREYIDRDIISIDGADAKDLDDAVSVKRLDDNKYFLGVYIADVSYFVKEDSEISKQALKKGNSVYLLNNVIPMLPFKLCNDLCSLNELEDKYVIALECIIDNKGNVEESELKEAIIKSKHRMTYDNVNILIDYLKSSDKDHFEKMDVVDKYRDILNMVQDMKDLSYILRAKRKLRGALDFDIPEPKFIIDEASGKILDVKLRERFDAEKLIEDFMICANEVVAETITNLDLPFIYRVHDEPSALKIEELKNMLKQTKFKLNMRSKSLSPLALQELLNRLSTKDANVSSMLLKMMAKAKYQRNNIGHFGLASKCYTHFTSPIRRYSDLLVHRLIRKYIFNADSFYSNYSEKEELAIKQMIDDVSKTISLAEVNSNNCEFELIDMKKAEFMEDKIGNVFDATITSVLNFGFFVVLDNTIEGLVHIRDLKDDRYIYNDNSKTLSGLRYKHTYRIGDKVYVKCVNANKNEREVNFIVLNKTKKDFKKSTNVVKSKKKKIKH